MKIYRRLESNKIFWGFVRIRSGGYRFGFGCGFLEWGKNSIAGLWLPRKVKN